MISISLPSPRHWFPRRLFLHACLHFIISVFVLFTFDSVNSPFICGDKNWRIFFCYLGCCPLTKIQICLKTVLKNNIWLYKHFIYYSLVKNTMSDKGKLAEMGFVSPPPGNMATTTLRLSNTHPYNSGSTRALLWLEIPDFR